MSSGDGLNRFRTRFFLAAALLGGAAGALAGLSRDDSRTVLALATAGPILLFVGGGLGGIVGGLLAAFRGQLRRGRSEPLAVDGDAAMLLAVFGALLGLVLAVFTGAHANAHWWAAAGAFAGGLAESFSGRLSAVLLHLTVLDELTDEERAWERRTEVRDRDLEKFLEDEGDDPPPPGRK